MTRQRAEIRKRSVKADGAGIPEEEAAGAEMPVKAPERKMKGTWNDFPG